MSKLQKEIEYLKEMLLRMADKVFDNLNDAFDMYLNYDESHDYDIINDDVIDAMERAIEEECLNIMLKERPYSRDLREVSGILKLVADLERLGDHAEDVCNFSMMLKNVEKHHIEEITKLIKDALCMVKDSIQAFIEGNVDVARGVVDKDDLVDEGYALLIEKLIHMLDNNEASSKFVIYTTLVVKYIERIADHAVNVAEWVIYIESGYHKDKRIF